MVLTLPVRVHRRLAATAQLYAITSYMRLVKMQRALYAALLTLTLRVPRQLATKATAEQYSVSVLTVARGDAAIVASAEREPAALLTF